MNSNQPEVEGLSPYRRPRLSLPWSLSSLPPATPDPIWGKLVTGNQNHQLPIRLHKNRYLTTVSARISFRAEMTMRLLSPAGRWIGQGPTL